MTEFIDYEVSESIATITIDRPKKRNALSYAMYDSIRACTLRAQEDRAVRSIVLTGVPGQFCAGTDLSELEEVDDETNSSERSDQTDGTHWFVADCTKPIIAAIDGPAAGLGTELATQCDFRIASSEARFSWIFVQRGLIPDTGAGTWLLPQQVGPQQAKKLVLSGEFVSAEEALRIGYLIDVVEPDELSKSARDLARAVSTGSPFAIERAKALINGAASRTRPEHLRAHAQALTECQQSEDHHEGVQAFLQKRPAKFTGR